MAWGFRKTLGSELSIAAIYDRDYRCDEESTELKSQLEKEIKFAHFHHRKEIENYLISPQILERAANRTIKERARRTGSTVPVDFNIAEILKSITNELKSDCSGQFISKYCAYFKSSGKDQATLTTEALKIFDRKWSSMESRLEIVAGKDVLMAVRSRFQQSHGITLTNWRIIDCYQAEEIPQDVARLLGQLDAFRDNQENR